MKTNAFFFFSTALFAFTAAAEIVLDSNGAMLINRGTYYMLPPGYGGQSIKGAGIGNGDGSCSLAVVEKLSYNKGWATRIASPYLTLHITTDFPVWISFTKLPLGPCTENPSWLVATEPGFGDAVMVGDSNEFPSPLSGVFNIKPYDSAKYQYKLVFCKADGCGHVGVKADSHGNNRLIVTQDENVKPLVLTFVKETSDISMVV